MRGVWRGGDRKHPRDSMVMGPDRQITARCASAAGRAGSWNLRPANSWAIRLFSRWLMPDVHLAFPCSRELAI
jgi:hypothetical protein